MEKLKKGEVVIVWMNNHDEPIQVFVVTEKTGITVKGGRRINFSNAVRIEKLTKILPGGEA